MIFRQRWLILLDALFLAALGLYVMAGVRKVPFHGDEATFVAMSQDYHTLFHDGDVESIRYQAPTWRSDRQYLRTMNGAVNPLTIGLAWDLAGYSVRDLNDRWDWIEEPQAGWDQWAWNLRLGNKPPDDLLHVARIPSAAFTVLSVVVVFGIARRLSGRRIAAWTASLIYITTPGVLVNGRRAMQEGSLLFATALVILIAIQAIRAQEHPSWRGRTAWYLALGAASGFAVACKHSAAVIVLAAFVPVAILPWRRHEASLKRHLYCLTAAVLMAILASTAFLPVWWSLPNMVILLGLIALALMAGFETGGAARWLIVGGIVLIGLQEPATWFRSVSAPLDTLSARSHLMEVQAERVGGQESLGERAETLVRESFFADGQYYEDPPWAGFESITAQIATYERGWLDGRGGWAWGALLIALGALGARWLVAHRHESTSLLVACWLLIPALTLMNNPLAWQRYYIILHAPLGVLAGLGIVGLGQFHLFAESRLLAVKRRHTV